MQFKVLGALETVDDVGDPVSVRGARRRALLIRLLIDANRVVGTDTLVEDVWNGKPPAGAVGTLQSHVSLLRRLVGSRLVSQPPGYVVEVDHSELDALAFEHGVDAGRVLLEQGHADQAVSSLQRANGQWRGPALIDVADSEWARSDITRLEQLRAASLEVQIEALLRLGRDQEAIALAQQTVVEHPFRELLWSYLMFGLSRQGRQADALRTYQRLRNHLGEVGIEPSQAVARLEEAILLQEALPEPWPEREGKLVTVTASGGPGGSTLVATGAPDPATAPAAPPHTGHGILSPYLKVAIRPDLFVGRQRELQEVHHLADGIGHDRRARAFLISGVTGIGKSQLALAAAEQLADRGFLAVGGECDRAHGSYRPVAQIVHQLREMSDFTDLVDEYLDDLSLLGPPLPDVEGAPHDHELLHRQVVELFRAIGRKRPIAMTIDSAGLADAQLTALLRHLFSDRTGLPMLGIISVGRTYLRPPLPLVPFLRDCQRHRADRWIELRGLDADELLELVSHRGGDRLSDHRRVAEWLAQDTDGHSLLASRLLDRLLRPEPVGRLADHSSVASLMQRWTATLDDDERDTIASAAVIGPSFDVELLATVVERSELAVLDALEEATRLCLVTDGGRGSFEFVSPIVREAMTGGLSPSRRSLLHRRTARALAERATGGRVGDEQLFAIANHWVAGAQRHDAVSGLEWVEQAAGRALARDPQAAAHWYGVASALMELGGINDAAKRARLLAGLVAAKAVAGFPGPAEQREEAHRAARAIGSPALVSLLIMGRPLAVWNAATDEGRHDVDEVKAALEFVGESDPGAKARRLSRLAALQMWSLPLAERTALVDEALGLAQGRSAFTRMAVNASAALALTDPSTIGRRLALSDEATRAAYLSHRADLLAFALGVRLLALAEAGNGPSVRSCHDDLTRIAPRVKNRFAQWTLTADNVRYANLMGDTAEARAAMRKLRILDPTFEALDTPLAYQALWCVLARIEGRHRDLVAAVRPLIGIHPNIQAFPAAVAASATLAGDHQLAVQLIEQAAADDFGPTERPDHLTALLLWAEAVAEASAVDHAEQLLEALRSHHALVDAGLFSLAGGPVALYLSLLSALMGRREQADEYLTEADEIAQRLGSNYERARVHLWWARTVASIHGMGDDRVADHARKVVDLAPVDVTWELTARARRFLSR